ncbi:restriction endonuclease subunit S [Clostridium perfringens]|uniref:restriction endonuclease subunit S n=1 Tax=Clostridium perfringens TaxID=1502 RepID=UPI0039E82B4F
MTYKRYEKYKYSGIDWIGEVPAHWNIGGMTKYIDNIVDYRGKTPEKVKEGIFLVTAKNIKDGVINYDNSKEYIKYDDYEEVMKRGKPKIGEVLFTTEAPLGEVANVDNENIALAQRIIKFSSNKQKLNNYFLKYWILSNGFQNNLKSLATGSTAEGIKSSKLFNLKVVLPTISEQETIVRFLDSNISKIDSLIQEKEELIKLLYERKEAMIRECVTKGISNIDVKIDSDVEWIGLMPKGWKCIKVKYIFDIIKNIAGETGFNILSVTQKGIKIKDISKNKGQISMDYSKYQIVNIGDFIMNHMDLLTGWVDCSKYFGVTSPDYRVFRLKNNREFLTEYYKYVMQVCYSGKIFYGLGQGVSNLGRWRLQTDKFKEFKVPVPPKEEQCKIVKYIESRCRDINYLCENIFDEITILKEYRIALITESVTGKIDVRNYER